MARPSKLSPEQWRGVERRAAEGESVRALAREFGVDEAAIRRRVSPQTPQVRTVASQLAAAQTALAALPVPQQHIAVSLAEKLRNISSSLAGAAEIGANNAQRLHAMAMGRISAAERGDVEALRYVAAATKTANDAAQIGINLLAVNKGKISEPNDVGAFDASGMSTDALAEIMRAKDATVIR